MKKIIILIILCMLLASCSSSKINEVRIVRNIEIEIEKLNYPNLPYHIDIDLAITNTKGVCIRNADEVVKIYGSSMEDMAFEGNKFIMQKYKGEKLEVGDIIKFKYQNYLSDFAVHQIVWTDGINYATKGYNVDWVDHNLITKDDVEGIVLGVIFT